MKIIQSKFTLLALAGLLFVASSCSKRDPAPDLPEEQSFIMDFSNFEDGKTGRTTDSLTNWGISATTVLVWNVVITVQGIVPVAAFLESFNHEADWDRKLKRYVWEYSVWVLAKKYDVALHGWLANGDANWELHVSSSDFGDFTWYTGRTAIDRTSADWTLNFSPQDPKPYVAIDYDVLSTDGSRKIRYTNIIPGHAGNGGYIEYGLTNDVEHDRYYDIFAAETGNLVEIEWHHLNANGRIKNETHFGDTDWHCWDNTLVDAICQ